VIIDTGNTALYYVLGQNRAIRYGVGVGREGFTWSGTQTITRKAEWPDWHPPAQMIARQPYLPRFMAGGPGNPLGARAMYLGSSEYRIHGTNDPSTIGKFVSSGCIRLTNEDVADLFSRVEVGTRVVVLAKNAAISKHQPRPMFVPASAPPHAVAPAAGRPSHEPFDVVIVLRLTTPVAGGEHALQIGQVIITGAAAVVCASTLVPAAHAEDFLSALFGAFGARPQAPSVPLSFASEGDTRAFAKRGSFTVGLFRRFAGLLRAHMRRTLFPDQRLQRPEPRRVLQQFLPCQRNKSGLRQQYR